MSKQEKEKERKFLLECIKTYKELPALWKVKSEDYTNKTRKDLAYEKLLTKYRERYENATKEDLKRKFNALRTNFRKEVKKVNDSHKVAGGRDLYESSLWYYDAMLFLLDQDTSAASSNTVKHEELTKQVDDNQSQNDDDVQSQTTRPASVTTSFKPDNGGISKRKKVCNGSQRDELTSLACKRLRNPENEHLNVAKVWASEISQMEEQQQLFAKKAINDILFEGRMGTLHRFSVQINVAIPQPSRSSTPLTYASYDSCEDSSNVLWSPLS